jgi:hypothetical protein
MKKTLSPQEWAQEFQEFTSAEEIAPPLKVTQKILAHVESALNPPWWSVLSRLALIQMIVGAVTLLFCPQFGINLGGGAGLMGVFMRWGEEVCMLGCGAVFLGTSALVSSLVLRPEEIKVIRQTELLQFSILGLLSISIFIITGATAVGTLALFWLVGSILGGLMTLELGWLVRTQLRKRVVYGI